MKILVVGGTGTIGSAIVNTLNNDRHEVISAGLTHGDIQVDITKPHSISKMYKQLGTVDAVIAATGNMVFKPLNDMTNKDFAVGLDDKLMGQVNLVLLGIPYLNDGGSFTLTSGCLAYDPIVAGSSASMVNAALHGFTIGSAIELPKGLRINCVSPLVIEESLDKFAEFFPGFRTISARRCARYYVKSVEGAQTGQIYIAE